MAAKTPEERYQDYDALLADVQRVKGGSGPVFAPPSRNARTMVWIGGAVAATVIIVLSCLLIFSNKHPRTPVEKASPTANGEAPVTTPPGNDAPPDAPPRERGAGRPERPEFSRRGDPPGGGPPEGRMTPFDDPQGMILPMGGPPMLNFFTIPPGTYESMLAAADNYATQNPDNFEEISDAYQQVKRRFATTHLREIEQKISAMTSKRDKLVDEAFSQREATMREKIAAKQWEEAFLAWADFPPGLRNKKTDDRIRNLLKASLPADFRPPPPRQ
jgi:hypothetical protein